MLEIALDARRGSFHLQIETRLAAEWTVIFGPSGSGKSTLLRLLAGLDRDAAMPPGRARVVFNGQALSDTDSQRWDRPGRRSTALVTQQPALFPNLSIRENLSYGLAHLDRQQCAARVDEMIDLVGARHLGGRRPQDLSGGEAQRVALARALAPGPQLLLLDEPFSALDGSASDDLLDRLRRWVVENRVQTILATHDVTDAFVTGAEVALLREGRLAALGPAAQVLSQECERLMQRLSE